MLQCKLQCVLQCFCVLSIESRLTFENVDVPLTEEITLTIFASPDLSVFLIDLLSDSDSVHSRENSFEILRTPVKTCLIFSGAPVKTCWTFGQS